MTKKTARLVRKLDWKTDAALYKLSEPVEFRNTADDKNTTDYVIASAVIAFDHGGEECLIFPAKENGETWSMLDIGGRRGTMSHETVLWNLGFSLE